MNPCRSISVGIALLLLGCSAGASSTDSGEPPSVQSASFIAFAGDFAGFHGWEHYAVYDDAGTGDPGHPDHTLIEYINHRPDSGSSSFSVGTIIVKEGTSGEAIGRQFFAMVKRGGNYNAQGLSGWEWFELQNLADPVGSVSIVWRGFGPPQGEIYGGNAKAGCNECHLKADFDGVYAPQARP